MVLNDSTVSTDAIAGEKKLLLMKVSQRCA